MFYGHRRGSHSQLVAAKYDIEGIRSRIGADSLAYLSLPGMESAVRETLNGTRPHGHCTACFPVSIAQRAELAFEEDRARLFISVAQA